MVFNCSFLQIWQWTSLGLCWLSEAIYALLSEFPSVSAIAESHLARLTNLLSVSSKGHYRKDTAILFREAARTSIGSQMPAKSLELKHTIKLMQEITAEIDEIELSTYQSGQLESSYSHMEKRGPRYLRYALYNATKYVCHWDPAFAAYLEKKRSEGKHYNVAISHAAKKLVRVIYQLQETGQSYIKAA